MNAQASRPMMSFPEAVAQCLRNYVGFSGRATRAEYWWWVLAITVCQVTFGLLMNLLPEILLLVSGLFGLAVLLPSLAVTTRRLHDIGKSGRWMLPWIFMAAASGTIAGLGLLLLGLSAAFSAFGSDTGTGEDIGTGLMIVGFVPWAVTCIWVIVWLARQGDAGPNRFGEDPRAN